MLQLKKSRGTRAPFAAVTAPDSAELFFKSGNKVGLHCIYLTVTAGGAISLSQAAGVLHTQFPWNSAWDDSLWDTDGTLQYFLCFLQLNSCLKNSLFFPPINFPTFPVMDWCDFYVNALSFIFPPSVSHYIFLICPISPCFLYVY